MESEIIKLIKNNYVDGIFKTHVSMVKPKGSFLFTREVLEEFWKLYCKLMTDSNNYGLFGIAESPQHYYPVIVDIDIKFQEKDLPYDIKQKIKYDKSSHIYTEKHVKQIIEIYVSTLRQILRTCKDDNLLCCLLEKPVYTQEKNDIKYYSFYS